MPDGEDIKPTVEGEWGDSTHLEKREAVKVIRQAVVNGWEIPVEVFKEMPTMLADMARSAESPRDRIRALECLKGMVKDKVEAAKTLDNIERLDAGKPTEIQRQQVFRVEFDD